VAWTAPTIRATGYLVTASDWNTDLVANLLYLKGAAGPVEIEDDILMTSGASITAEKIFAGPYHALHKGTVRELSIDWSDDSLSNYQIDYGSGNGGSVLMGGSGQLVLKVDLDDVIGSYAYINNKEAVNTALVTPVNASRNPYLRVEFSHHENSLYSNIFIGLRETPGGGVPTGEKFAGISWFGGLAPAGKWYAQNGDGASNAQTEIAGGLTASVRHTVEVIIIGGSEVEIYVDGTLVHNGVTYLPTGDLHWSVVLFGIDDPVANDGRLTVAKIIQQENLT